MAGGGTPPTPPPPRPTPPPPPPMTPPPLHKLLLATALALAAFLLAASTASARLLWTANAERPEIQEWSNHSCQNGDRVNRVTSPAAQGSRSYRIDVRDGDDAYGER